MAAGRGGVSGLTWSQVERAVTDPRMFTLSGIDTGLGWPPGTAVGILTGAEPPPPGSGRPIEAGSPSAPPDQVEIAERLARLEAKVDAILALVAAASRGAQ